MRVTPQALSRSAPSSTTLSGAMSPAASRSLPHTLSAALTEICWPTMERAKEKNGSSRGRSAAARESLINAAITSSAAFR